MDLPSVAAGLVAYAVSVALSVLLVFGTYRFSAWLTPAVDEQRLLLEGRRSVGIALGAVVVSQALLLRHAVFPTMVVIRSLFLQPFSWASTLSVLAQCALVFGIVGGLSVGSVTLAVSLFSRMTRGLPEHEEIAKGNEAVAVFFALVVLAITLIVNEGLADLARALVPFGGSGLVRLS